MPFSSSWHTIGSSWCCGIVASDGPQSPSFSALSRELPEYRAQLVGGILGFSVSAPPSHRPTSLCSLRKQGKRRVETHFMDDKTKVPRSFLTPQGRTSTRWQGWDQASLLTWPCPSPEASFPSSALVGNGTTGDRTGARSGPAGVVQVRPPPC